MTKRRHGLNPAKLKADLAALEQETPTEAFGSRLDIRRRPSVALLCLLSSVLLLVSFAPYDQWFVGYVALVPWGLAVVGGYRRRWALLWGYLGGVLFWSLGVYWLTWITLVGYLPLVLYLGLGWLVAAAAVREAFRRRWPLWAVLPVVWVAVEYVRGLSLRDERGEIVAQVLLLAIATPLVVLLSRGLFQRRWAKPAIWLLSWAGLEVARASGLGGFPWFFLAHGQYQCTPLIQVADVTGQYGVTFFVAMVNGAVIDMLARPLIVRTSAGGWVTRKVLVGGGACVAAAGLLLIYGSFRLGQKTFRPGPKVGVVQLAFPISLFQAGAPPEEIFARHLDNSRPLVGAGCRLVVWPESMLGHYDMDPALWFARDPDETDSEGLPRWSSQQREIIRTYQAALRALQRLLAELGCPLLAGGGMRDSVSGLATNSALLFDRDPSGRIRLAEQYAKMQLVPFGEYVPFRHGWPGLHRLLRRFVPEAMPQMLSGRRRVRFRVGPDRPGRQGQAFRFAVPICYEGVFARVCRRMVVQDGQKQVDMLVNISNDGWFVFATSRWTHAGTELEQHLVQYVFRAVECRVPVVRAVNTGVSAHVDSNGRILQVVQHRRRRTMVAGHLVAQTVVDERVSVYSFVGDVFAQAVTAAACVMAVVLLRRSRRH